MPEIGEKHEALQILNSLEPHEYKSVIRMLRGLAKPHTLGDSELLDILPVEKSVLLAFRSLQDNDRETIIRILDSFARG